MSLGPNEALIGTAGYERELATPALLLDLDAFEGNLLMMADRVAKQLSAASSEPRNYSR